MSRVGLILAYDGTNYHGWQSQPLPNISTIQQQLENSLAKVANQVVKVVAAGRTDAKVHASYQVVHFDVTIDRPISAWIYGTNHYLPPDIRVIWANFMPPEFNARKSAVARTYDYWIYNATIKPSLFRNYICWEHKKLEIELMQQASKYWLGEHDFTSFRGKDCQSLSSYRTVYAITCNRYKNLIKITITANAFLKHMVRNMVGALIKISKSPKHHVGLAREILLARNRACSGVTAPPQGLYLSKVDYPEEFKLPQDFADSQSSSLLNLLNIS